MAIAYGSAGTALNQSVASTSWAVPYPAGIAAGDLLVLHMLTSATVTSPAGWTLIYNETVVTNPRGGVWIKVAAGTETGNLTVSVGSATGAAQMHRYTGVDTTTPQDAAATNVSLNATTDATIDLPAITTVTANAWLVYACASNSTSLTHTSAGANERADIAPAIAKAGALYDIAVATPASTARTITQSAARAYWGAMLALRPAAGASSNQTVIPGGVALTAGRGTPAAATAITAAPGGVAVASTRGTPTATTATTAAPAGKALAAGRGTPGVSTAALVTPSSGAALATGEGNPSVSAAVLITPTGVALTAVPGTPAIVTANSPQTAAPAGVALAAGRGTPVVSAGVLAAPAGVQLGTGQGNPGITGAVTSRPAGLALTAAEGAPTAGSSITARPGTVAAAVTPAAPALTTAATASPDPAGTTIAAGTPDAATGLTAAPDGFMLVLFAGEPVAAVSQDQLVGPGGVSIGVAAGTPAGAYFSRAIVGIIVGVDRWKAVPSSPRYVTEDDPSRLAAGTSWQPPTATPTPRWEKP